MTDNVPVHRVPGRRSNYDRLPSVPAGDAVDCVVGWDAAARALRSTGARVFVIDAYPGVRAEDLQAMSRALAPDLVIDTLAALRPEPEIDQMIAPFVTDDPVFGVMSRLELREYFAATALEDLRRRVRDASGTVVIHGVGASLISEEGLVVYCDLPRWEIQQRQRRGVIGNLGATNLTARPAEKYKRAYFVDWRVADRHKRSLWERVAFFLDTVASTECKLVRAQHVNRALEATARRPFRVVPLFDPAPWGGHWMQTVCDVGHEQKNLGWCFDCVPEENSLLLAFGARRVELPAIDLVFREPRALLGEAVYGRFGAEFPIRFDFLDTMSGGALSLQVHPPTEYIQRKFGMHYTQDESYYLLDADSDAGVYLGLRENVAADEMVRDLTLAQKGGPEFPAERYVNRFPARRHDHFLIPAGTVHGAGRNSMVLEISSTPYIFTFKLWDWGRLGLDGRPRPIHLLHGCSSIAWHRDTAYAKRKLINQVTPLASGPGWREERTGLHEAEFIETRRHWFHHPVLHRSRQSVQVLNLVQGEEAVVESPDGAFEPLTIHYAETFIVPAAAGDFTLRPQGPGASGECATIKAFVRGA